MGGSVRIFVLNFFSKQIPGATTAGRLSQLYSDSAFVFSCFSWESGGGGREKGTIPVGKLESPTRYRTVPMQLFFVVASCLFLFLFLVVV